MKKGFALLLCGFIMLSLVNSVNASNIAVTSKRTIVSEGVYNNGTESQIGNIPSLDEEVNGLNETIKSGEVAAKKSGYFENEKDKEERTVKINIDLTAKGVETGGDTVFILDESGSMGMYSDTASRPACQNPEHYYLSTNKGYIRLIDYMSASDMGDWLTINPALSKAGITGVTQNEHYVKKEDGSFEKVVDELPIYASPSFNNQYGCYDKGTIAHKGIYDITNKLITSNPNNRVAFISFATSVRDNLELTNDLSVLLPAMEDTKLALGTNYGTGIASAKTIIENRSDKDRPLSVVFISDGEPLDGFTTSNANYQYIKNIEGVKIYTINITSRAETLLKNMAYPSDLYSYCADLDDLNNVFSSLADSLSGYPKAEITDVVGKDFTLRVDENHPITIDGVEYKNIKDIPKEIATISEDERTLTFTPEIVTEKGYRISFYEKLNDDVLEKDEIDGVYDTNEKCEIKYKKLNIDGGTIIEDSEYTTITLPTPEYKIVTKIENDNNGNNNGGNNDNTPNDSENNKNDEIKGAVNTSDENNIYLYITLLGVSILGMGYILRKKFVK